MENKIDLAILEAKKYLAHPRDAAHNLDHHKAVWKNCEDIIKEEKLRINPNLVKVAAFWHDVVLKNEGKISLDNVKENVDYLKKYLPSVGFTEKETGVILETILHHEFRDNPTNVEGLILQDADKLDVLSTDRWNRTMDAFESGEISKEKYISYAKTSLNWILILESTFHYKYSRKVAHILIQNIFDNKRQIEMFNKLGLQKELGKSMKSMNSPATKIKRLAIRVVNIKTEILIYIRTYLQ